MSLAPPDGRSLVTSSPVGANPVIAVTGGLESQPGPVSAMASAMDAAPFEFSEVGDFKVVIPWATGDSLFAVQIRRLPRSTRTDCALPGGHERLIRSSPDRWSGQQDPVPLGGNHRPAPLRLEHMTKGRVTLEEGSGRVQGVEFCVPITTQLEHVEVPRDVVRPVAIRSPVDAHLRLTPTEVKDDPPGRVVVEDPLRGGKCGDSLSQRNGIAIRGELGSRGEPDQGHRGTGTGQCDP